MANSIDTLVEEYNEWMGKQGFSERNTTSADEVLHRVVAVRWEVRERSKKRLAAWDARVEWLELQAVEAPSHQREQFAWWAYDEKRTLECWCELAYAQQCAEGGNDEQAVRHLLEVRRRLTLAQWLRGEMPPAVMWGRYQWID